MISKQRNYPFIGQVHDFTAILLLLFALLSFALVFTYVYPLLGMILKHKGLSDEDISFLFSFAESGELVMFLIMPLILSRLTIKTITLFCFVTMIVGLLSFNFLPAAVSYYYPFVFMLNFSYYLMMMTGLIACNKWSDPKHRGTMVGISTAILFGGAILSSLILKFSPHNFTLFWFGGIGLSVVAVVQLFMPHLGKYHLVESKENKSGKVAPSEPYFDKFKKMIELVPIVLVALVFILITKVVIKGVLESLSVFDAQDHIQFLVATQVMATFIGAFVIAMFLGRLFDRFNNFYVMCVVYTLTALAFIWLEFFFVDNVYLQTLAFILVGPAIYGSYTLAQKVVGDRLDPEKIAVGANLLGLFGAIVSMASPTFFGLWLSDMGTINYFWPFIIFTVFGVVVTFFSGLRLARK